jgi:hypothetical protein
LQRRDDRPNRGGGTVHIVGGAINDLESKFTRLGRGELFGELRRFAFHPRFVGTDDRTNVGSCRFGFGFRHSSAFRICRECSQGHGVWGAQATSLFVSAACRDCLEDSTNLRAALDVAGKLPATAG